MYQKRALWCLLPCFLWGCSLGPDYVRPNLPLAEAWRLPVEDSRTRMDLEWWKQLGDPVLDQLVATAIQDNIDLRIAAARLDEYAARFGVARAESFPTIGADAEAARQKNFLAGSLGRPPSNRYSAIMNVQWELDLWGRIARQQEAAYAEFISTREAKRAVFLSLVSQLVSAYVNLRSLDQQLVIAKDTLKAREISYQLFQARYAGGVVSLVELSQAQSQYNEAQATLPLLESAIAAQENALSLLLGQNPQTIVRGQALHALKTPPLLAGLPSALIDRRPDILAAEQNLIAANAMIGVAKSYYFPRISLTGLFGQASTALSDLFKEPSRLWSFGGGVSLPIFTAGQIGEEVNIAEARQRQALLIYQKTVQNAFREVNDALIAQDRTRVQSVAKKDEVNALQQYANVARLRYENGYTSYLEVLDAERALFSAQLEYTRTQQALLQSMIDLYKALGGPWE